MKKEDLLKKLDDKFAKVLKPQERRAEAGIKWYLVGAYDKDGDVMRRINIGFYVENEGMDAEKAYWTNSEPKPEPTPPPPTFQGRVQGYITEKIAGNVIEEGAIERVNENNKTAIVRIVMDENGVLKEHRFLVNLDSEGNLQHLRID